MWLVATAWGMESSVRLHTSGLRTRLEAAPHEPRVDVALVVAAGAADDPVGTEGLAHIVEHLWFEARLDGVRTDELYRRTGCESNAYTEAEVTTYVFTCIPEALPGVLETLADLFRPWTLSERDVAAASRVVALEEGQRAENSEIREAEAFDRQLLPASHPARLRAARPPLGAAPTLSAVSQFVAAHYRPDRASLAITGAFQEDDARRQTDVYFGVGSAVDALPPLRAAPASRSTLRLATRTLPGIAQDPVVYLGWSLPVDGGWNNGSVAALLEVSLHSWLDADPRVLDFACQGSMRLFTAPFQCRIRTVDDAAAAAIGEAAPARFGTLLPTTTKAVSKQVGEIVKGQNTLWNLLSQSTHDVDIQSRPARIARGLVEGWKYEPRRAEPSLEKFLRSAMLADTALVVVMPGDAPPRPPVTPGAEIEFGAAIARHDRPHDTRTPVVAVGRTLTNGLRLVAAQRADSALLVASLHAEFDGSAAAARVAWGARPEWNPAWRPDVIVIDREHGPVTSLTLATIPEWSEFAAEVVLDQVTHLDHDDERATRMIRAYRRSGEAGHPDGGKLASLIPRLASGGSSVGSSWRRLEAVTSAEVLRAREALFDPTRTRIGLVGPDPPQVMLDAFAAAFDRWQVPHRAPVPTAPSPPIPRGAFLEVPALVATVAAECRPVARGGAGAVIAEIVRNRIFHELRVRRAWAYSPWAFPWLGSLAMQSRVQPGHAAEALGVLREALSPPTAGELQSAQVEARYAAPSRLAARNLAPRLARGDLDATSVAGWDDAVSSVTQPVADAALVACRDTVSWAIAGPAGTAIPEGTPRLTSGALAELLAGTDPAR